MSEEIDKCLLCLEECKISINKFRENVDCKCKYNIHDECYNELYNNNNKCVICKKNIKKEERVLEYIYKLEYFSDLIDFDRLRYLLSDIRDYNIKILVVNKKIYLQLIDLDNIMLFNTFIIYENYKNNNDELKMLVSHLITETISYLG